MHISMLSTGFAFRRPCRHRNLHLHTAPLQFVLSSSIRIDAAMRLSLPGRLCRPGVPAPPARKAHTEAGAPCLHYLPRRGIDIALPTPVLSCRQPPAAGGLPGSTPCGVCLHHSVRSM